MTAVWNWLKEESNRKVLGWIIAGAGSVALYFGFFKPDEKIVKTPPAQSSTSSGGNAINASGSATVNVNVPNASQSSTPITPTSFAPKGPVALTGSQTAVSNGGNAINASGSAQVNVKP